MSQNEMKRKELFYMAIALLSEKRSKDPIRKVGACIVNEREGRIVGIGYNGMPLNCRDDIMPWKERNAAGEKLKHYYRISKVVYLSFDQCYRDKPEYGTSELILNNNGVISVPFQGIGETVRDKFLPKKVEKTKQLIKALEEPIEQLQRTVTQIEQGQTWLDELKSQNSQNEKRAEILQKTFLKHISWEQYFMGLAITARDFMCGDDSYKGGACIVNEDNRIVGLGFHDRLLIAREKKEDTHAEINAIVSEQPVSLKDCTMYVTHFPCHNCAQVIIQSGIKAIIYLGKKPSDSEEREATERMFELAKVRRVEYKRCYETRDVILDFSESDL